MPSTSCFSNMDIQVKGKMMGLFMRTMIITLMWTEMMLSTLSSEHFLCYCLCKCCSSIFSTSSSQQPLNKETTNIFILHMKKLRRREEEQLVCPPHPPENKWHSQDTNPGAWLLILRVSQFSFPSCPVKDNTLVLLEFLPDEQSQSSPDQDLRCWPRSKFTCHPSSGFLDNGLKGQPGICPTGKILKFRWKGSHASNSNSPEPDPSKSWVRERLTADVEWQEVKFWH